MSRPWQYTRSRRTLMQGVMWLILGGTVGLAALVSNQRSNPQNVPLDPPVTYGALRIRPPQGWRGTRSGRQLVFREEGADPDDETDQTGRTLRIHQDPGISVQADVYFLAKAAPLGAAPRDAQPISMCGQKGILATLPENALVVVDRQVTRPGWSVLACTVLPTGWGVTVQLRTPKRPVGADYALVKAVARNLMPVTPVQNPVQPNAPTPNKAPPEGNDDQ